MKLAIVIGSTRQGRVSERLAKWVEREAQRHHPEHEWKIVDLKRFELPLFDEPKSPQGNPDRQVSEPVAAYLVAMGEVDGFVIVTPEYNHAMPAVLKNALDLLDVQFIKKPVAIVSHGSVGGARANEQVRVTVNSSLGAVPIPASLTFFGKVTELIDDEGNDTNQNDLNRTKTHNVLEQLLWYSEALKVAREK